MNKTLLCVSLILTLAFAAAAQQTTAFTYQGKLSDGANAAPTGAYDLRFTLDRGDFLISCNGAATTNNICQDVPVANGIFTVRLDFGAGAFGGATQNLGIGVRRGDETGAFTPLAPAQPITSAPYAIQSLNATNAVNATNAGQLGGVAAANFARRDAANTFAGNQTVNGDLAQTGTSADLNLTNGFVARGTPDAGAIPATGAGTRMMFYPKKSAFRAGAVNGSQWDDANIGYDSVALGYNTTASGLSSVALGDNTTASGNNTTALGYYASTNNQIGSFVIGDYSTTNIFNASTTNQFAVRAQNIWFGKNNSVTNTPSRFIETSTGAYLSNSGVWTNNSSVNLKSNFAPVNSRDILQKVLKLPVTNWNYKVDAPNVRHIGAMAQDFYKAFGVGADDEHITPIDTAGVAFAAIQGLHEELTDRDRKIEAQQRQIEEQQKNLNDLRSQVKRQQMALEDLKKLVCSPNAQAEFCREEKSK